MVATQSQVSRKPSKTYTYFRRTDRDIDFLAAANDHEMCGAISHRLRTMAFESEARIDFEQCEPVVSLKKSAVGELQIRYQV